VFGIFKLFGMGWHGDGGGYMCDDDRLFALRPLACLLFADVH
jgi:hypothetical protein